MVKAIELLNDFGSWLIKSRMAFHGVDLELPFYFGLFCWAYSMAGICMFWTEPNWSRHSKFPFRSFALFLIFIQAPLSFLADYCNMSNDSYWHIADRIVATPAMLLEAFKILVMLYHKVNPKVVLSYGIAIVFAVYCFHKSQEAQKALHRDGFVLYHNLWHM